MPDRVTTSFIPKEALVSERTSTTRKSRSPFVIINIVATFILISALLASAGVYIAQIYTKQAILSTDQSLKSAKASFEPESIRNLDKLAKRIKSAETLLVSHVAPSMVLDELQKRTMVSLRFNNLTLAKDPLVGGYKISMSGEAASLNVIAQQANHFATSTIIKDPLFSGVNTIENGNVIFNFSASIPKDRMTYVEYINSSRPIQAEEIEQLAP